MRIVVIGGGAAGMMACLAAAEGGHQIVLIEKNDKLGKKLFITGKGRCNVTNACDTEDLFSNIISNPKFLYGSIYRFTNDQVMDYFESIGVPLKVERGNRVFPVSDHSSDIIRALEKQLYRSSVEIKLNTTVTSINYENDLITGVTINGGKHLKADAVIIATGGKSYPACGSTGDGYRFAKNLKLEVISPEPSLVPFVVKEDYASLLMGLSLKNVKGSLFYKNKKITEDFGEMLFTHFGLSGPLVLTASCYTKEEMYGENLKYVIDLKPALTEKQLEARIQRDLDENGSKQFKNSLSKLLPSKLIPVILDLSEINGDKRSCDITKEEKSRLNYLLKNFDFTVIGNRGFNEAIITRGGISVKEIDPSDMSSKKYKGLFCAGEVLDLDALTGGYNLQIAWSTGYTAGKGCLEYLKTLE